MNQLQRQIGPLKLWQWLIVALLGIGLGLYIRRRISTKAGPGTGVTATYDGTGYVGSGEYLPATQGSAPAPEGQLIDWGSAYVIQEQQDRFLDELQSALEEIFTPIQEQLEAIIVPVPPSEPEPPKEPPKTSTPEQPKPKTPKEPEPTGSTYTVVKGDTLWKIAGRFGFSHWRPIYESNRDVIGPNPDLIRPGMVLRIPNK